jgi:hypothetical protein
VTITTPPEKAAIRAMQTEVLSDTSGPLLVELVPGVEVRVLPPRMWRVSAISAMQEGDFLGWAKKALASTDDYDIFVDTDPTLEQVEAFMQRTSEVSTEGNSKSSSRSTRRSARTRKS